MKKRSNILEDALSDAGFTVVTASTAEAAIASLDADGAFYKALVTDINLTDTLTGWDVAKRSREVNDGIPVLYMTGASAHEWASKGVPNSQITPKPFAVAQIVTAVSHLINTAATNLAVSSKPEP